MHQVGDVFATYLSELAARAEARHVAYAATALARLAALLGEVPADQVSASALLEWRTKRIADGISRETHNKEVGHVRAAFRLGRELGMVSLNPDRILRRLPVREGDRRKRGLFNVDELSRFLRASRELDRSRGTNTVPQYPLWRFLIETGSRRGEALALEWCDVRVDQLAVVHRAQHTKTRRRRQVAISPELALELEALNVARGPVFLTARGHPWRGSNADNVRREFDLVLARSGLTAHDEEGRRRSPHSFRHTLATLLAQGGVAPRVAQAVLGHADVRTTLAVYTHATEDDARLAVAALHGRLSA